jgi:hypothetical protein
MRVRLTRALLLLALAVSPHALTAQTLPPEEARVTFRSYSDTWGVDVLYPSVALTRRVAPSTSVTAHYQVDAITSASMKSRIPVDGITSATRREHGGAEGTFDEVRHEMGLGVVEALGESTLSCDVLYSTEPDYTSFTVIPSWTLALARRNTEIRLAVGRSWDELSPVIRSWSRDKSALSFEVALTQTLGPRLIAQVDLYHSTLRGLLSDPYQVVTIVDPTSFEARRYEPRHPERRTRRAVGVRTNLSISTASTLQLGWRTYWDSWDVRSTTVHGRVHHDLLSRRLTVGIGVRTYSQTSADFFRATYGEPRRYMTVDSRLDSSHSLEYEASVHLEGDMVEWIPGLDAERSALEARCAYYHRRTTTPDWHSRLRTLDALTTSVGLRYRF